MASHLAALRRGCFQQRSCYAIITSPGQSNDYAILSLHRGVNHSWGVVCGIPARGTTIATTTTAASATTAAPEEATAAEAEAEAAPPVAISPHPFDSYAFAFAFALALPLPLPLTLTLAISVAFSSALFFSCRKSGGGGQCGGCGRSREAYC